MSNHLPGQFAVVELNQHPDGQQLQDTLEQMTVGTGEACWWWCVHLAASATQPAGGASAAGGTLSCWDCSLPRRIAFE